MEKKAYYNLPIVGWKLDEFLINLAEDVIKMQKVENESSASLWGDSVLTAGRLIMRGVPLVIVNHVLTNEKGWPKDNAPIFSNFLLEMIKNTKYTDSKGNSGLIVINEQNGFSLEKDEMALMHYSTICDGAFIARDYAKCAETAEAALEIYSHAMLYQLLVISLQRLKRVKEEKFQGDRALSILRYAGWHAHLMLITLGEIDAEKVYAHANNDDDRCQVRFYEGARFVTLGKKFEARLSLSECNNCKTDLMEKWLVGAELDSVK